MNLQNDDFGKLVRIVTALSAFRTADGRYALLAAALTGNDRAGTILNSISWEGAAQTVAVHLLMSLQNFGQVVYGKEALGIFLNGLQDQVGDVNDQAFIRGLFNRYPLDVPTVAQPVVLKASWRGADTPQTVLEKVIGENTLRDYRILQLAVEAGRAVVHLRVQGDKGAGAGTGFMITPDILLTNHHVLESEADAAGTVYSFNYQLAPNGKPCAPDIAAHPAGGFFWTNPDLDYSIALLTREKLPDFGEPLTINPQKMEVGQRVAIIQHPGGNLKQFSDQNNSVEYADRHIVQYTTTTMRGSSGSPVFNDLYQVVALHHAGGELPDPGTGIRYLRNEGISMIAILADMEKNAPAVYAQVRRA